MLKRGWDILTKEGPVELLSRSVGFLAQSVAAEYYGRVAKRESPIEYHGVELPLDMEIFNNSVRHAFFSGSYEAAEVALIDEHVVGPYDIVDLGSSTGFTTVYALNKLDDRARGVAVEANPGMIEVINVVREINNVEFEVENSAYAPGQSEVAFHVHDKTVSSNTKQGGGREITVPGVSLEEVVTEYDIGEFVCLADIEGGEIDLVREELELLEERCGLIVVEIHEIGGIAEETKRRLSDSAFELIDSVENVYVYRNGSL
jgi:FkbM family methyltransferase